MTVLSSFKICKKFPIILSTDFFLLVYVYKISHLTKLNHIGPHFAKKVLLYLVAATDFHRWNTLTNCMIIDESVFKLVRSDNYSIAVFTVVARRAHYVYTKMSANSYHPTLCNTQKSKKFTILWWKPEISQL